VDDPQLQNMIHVFTEYNYVNTMYYYYILCIHYTPVYKGNGMKRSNVVIQSISEDIRGSEDDPQELGDGPKGAK
jgi:hypothetical protein